MMMSNFQWGVTPSGNGGYIPLKWAYNSGTFQGLGVLHARFRVLGMVHPPVGVPNIKGMLYVPS
jgi:hypothetical protein